MRITLNIFFVLVGLTFLSNMSYAQVPREVLPPQPCTLGSSSIQNSIPNTTDRLRISDQFFRHDQLRDAVRSGNILSLSIIRKTVTKQYPGQIVDVRLLVPKREGINYLYDVRVLTKNGKVLSVKVDAKNAKIFDVKG
jgi:hypothetical protein